MTNKSFSSNHLNDIISSGNVTSQPQLHNQTLYNCNFSNISSNIQPNIAVYNKTINAPLILETKDQQNSQEMIKNPEILLKVNNLSNIVQNCKYENSCNSTTLGSNTLCMTSKKLPDAIFIKDRKHTDDFKIEHKQFASGKFANVFHISAISEETTKSNPPPYCAKIVRRKRHGKDLTSDIKHECSILQLARIEKPKHIIKLIESYEQQREFQLILEYYCGGELWDHLLDQEYYNRDTHTVFHYKRYMFEIASGLAWLHKHRIVHLDLKPSNIFLSSRNFQTATAYIADFGLSRKLLNKIEIKRRKSLTIPKTKNKKSLNLVQDYIPPVNIEVNEYGEVRSRAGTPDFCAPEVLRFDIIELSADIFSLGCCYYIMLTGESAFQAEEENENLNKLEHLGRNFDMTNQKTFLNIEQKILSYDHDIFLTEIKSVNLLENLLKKKSFERLKIEEILKHEYFKEFFEVCG